MINLMEKQNRVIQIAQELSGLLELKQETDLKISELEGELTALLR